MSIILRKSDELLPQVERALHRLCGQLGQLLPDVELHHIGATALPGALTKGDLDILLRVSCPRFQTAVEVLKQHFEVKQPANWSPDFASFGDDAGFEMPVGLQVVVMDSSSDFFLFLREYLRNNREILDEYNRLKVSHADGDEGGYWRAKHEFFTRILASRTR